MKYKIHRCNCRKVWSVQTRKMKLTAGSILLNGKWTTELKPGRNCNPKGFVTTYQSQEIVLDPALELIEDYEKTAKLIYDKQLVNFNIKQGEYLYFAEDGCCYILKRR